MAGLPTPRPRCSPCASLLDVDVDDAGVMALAAQVGSDVPFCVQGGAAWMRGRGEIVEPVSVPTGLAFVVAIPPFRLSTPDVYAAWDELGGPQAEPRRCPRPAGSTTSFPSS